MQTLAPLPQRRRGEREREEEQATRRAMEFLMQPVHRPTIFEEVGKSLVPEGSPAFGTRRTVVEVVLHEGIVLSGDERVCPASGAATLSGQGRICSGAPTAAMSGKGRICSVVQAAVVRKYSSPPTSELSTGK